ncbi:MAG: PASTA domain-containing protein [Pseudomonadota bacterium]|nr:PASTA domain-containing protein [Pseudomonadota bacterium]
MAMGIAGPTFAAGTYVQSSSQSGSSSRSSSTASFTAAQTAGNLNVVFIAWQGTSGNLISVVDSMGNAYTRVNSVSYGTTATQVAYYAQDIVGAPAGKNTVTATFNMKVGNPDLRIVEYSGIDPTRPLDASGGKATTGVLTSSGAVTTTNANDLLVASNYSHQSVTGAGSGYTLRLKDKYAQVLEDKIVTTTGKYAATAPQTISGWYVMQLVAFRAAAAMQPVVVPDVAGQTQAAASSAITSLGLAVGTVTQQSSVTVAAGNVISESPIAGTSVTAGSNVNLVVSSGSTSVTVPNVIGQTQAAAGGAISSAGLVVGTVTQQSSSSVAAGDVSSQSPTAGSSAVTGSSVNLVVSTGLTGVGVPNVVGLTQAAAIGTITASGLALGTVTQQSSITVAAGNVISESPSAGTSVASGSTVNLTISIGPPASTSSPYPQSLILSGISWDETSKQRYANGSDIWDSMWASDDLIYGVWGDGNGFTAPAKAQIGVSQLTGSPSSPPLIGTDVYLGSPSPRVGSCGQMPTIGGKPRGVVALPNAVMYMFHTTYDLCIQSAWLARSLDNGMTWSDNVGAVWPDVNGFGPVAVLQYGAAQFGGLAPDNTLVPYIFIYGNKTNNSGSQYLARVPAIPGSAIETASNWSYYSGTDASGNPTWAASSAQAVPVWRDPNYAESLAVSFNPSLGRYIAYNDHGNACGGRACERQVSLFDGPSPWGPWTTFDYEEQFDNVNCGNDCLGNLESVGWAMMQKWFSADGLTIWVEYSATSAYDALNFINGTINLAAGSTVTRLSISTGAPAVVDRLSLTDPGNIEFIDSPARITSIPPAYLGTEVIRLARNDAPVANPSYVSFTSTVAQNVCVAWDSANVPPAWLSGWNNTGQSLVGDATFNVYSMTFAAGTVTLPGPGSSDGYILFVGCN